MLEKVSGFVKIGSDVSGNIAHVELWNPDTKERMTVACDDYEYQYGDGLVDHSFTFAERDYMLYDMPYFGGSKEIKKAYEDWSYQCYLEEGKILVGMTVEVFKGRKYPIGTTGVVKEFYTWCDQYGRGHTRYVITTDGKRIPQANCKPIA